MTLVALHEPRLDSEPKDLTRLSVTSKDGAIKALFLAPNGVTATIDGCRVN